MAMKEDLATRLSAYRDGELPEEEARVIESLLADDPHVQAEYDAILRADAAVARAFASMLKDPVPVALARAVNSAATPAQPAPAPAANTAQAPRWGMGLAAALALLAIGGAGGAFLSRSFDPSQQAVGWLDHVAEYHLVYASQKRHLVEVPASDLAHLQTWLSETTKVDFVVPDLTASGLTFQGARLLVASGKPVAQLMYTDKQGQVIAVCFMAGGDAALGEALSPFDTQHIGTLDMVSWKSNDATYVVVGPHGTPGLDVLAKEAAVSL